MRNLTTRLTALLLSGMLVIGSVPGSVFAASTDVDSGQTSEIAEEVYEEESSEAPVTDGEMAESEETSEDTVGAGETAEKASAEEEAQYYTVTLDANGGYFENEWDDAIGDYVKQAEVIEKYIPIDGAVAALPVFIDPDDQTMVFAGWSLERDGELVAQAEEEYIPVDNCVLYAVWQDEDVSVGETESQEVAEENSEKADVAQEPKGIDAALGDNVVIEDSLVKEESSDTITAEEGNVTEDAASESYTDPETESEQAIMDNQEAAFTDEDLENTSKESSDAAEAEGETQLEVFESSEEEVNVREGAATGIVASGTCGNNLTWTLDSEGTLTISGKGKMTRYGPWRPTYSDKIVKVIINNGVTSIGYASFEELKNLTYVSIADTVNSIEGWAFSYCDSLPDVYIPKNVNIIENGAFAGCKKLINVSVDLENNYFSSKDGVLFDKKQTVLICFPGGKNDSYSIPLSVTSIGEYAFHGCNILTRITIPSSVTSIGYNAFSGLYNLSDVYYLGSEDDWGAITINSGNSALLNATIHFAKGIEISLEEEDQAQAYTGDEIKPAPIVKDEDAKPSPKALTTH